MISESIRLPSLISPLECCNCARELAQSLCATWIMSVLLHYALRLWALGASLAVNSVRLSLDGIRDAGAVGPPAAAQRATDAASGANATT